MTAALAWCDRCGAPDAAVTVCHGCGMRFCDECWIVHRELTTTKPGDDHEVA